MVVAAVSVVKNKKGKDSCEESELQSERQPTITEHSSLRTHDLRLVYRTHADDEGIPRRGEEAARHNRVETLNRDRMDARSRDADPSSAECTSELRRRYTLRFRFSNDS